MEIQREDDEYLWGTCLNPQHEDNNASLCINKTDSGKYKRGFGYCYSCSFTIQFSEEAIKKMSNKKSIARKKVPVDWDSLVNKFINNPTTTVEVNKLSHSWGVSTLYHYRLGYDGGAITIPMWNEGCDICGILRRFKDGSKMCVHGSQLGLFLPDVAVEKVVITEGFSDAAVATHLGYRGIGKPSAGFGEQIVRKLLESEGYKGKIIIVQDNDAAGKRSTIKLQDALKKWETKVVIPESSNDLKEYYLKNGTNTTHTFLRAGE